MNKKAEWICTEDCHKKNKIQQRHGDYIASRRKQLNIILISTH